MRRHSTIHSWLTGVAAALFVAVTCTAEEAYEVTGKAWQANGAGKWDEVIRLADHSERTWGARARELNVALDGYPKGDAVKGYAVLNELATITWLKAGALARKGDTQAALAAYRKVLGDYTYGQCWDNKGWWWQPAKAAKDAVRRLAPETVEEVTVDAEPLKPALRLPGKKGICFTLRDPEADRTKKRGGSWDANIAKVKAVAPYWNYSWGMRRVPVQPADIEFLPMAWGAWGEDRLRKDLAAHVIPQIQAGKVKRFLAFNEPDKKEQANMGYQAALRYWPILQELKVPLCSPACANPLGVDDDSTQGVRGTWMRDFMTEADERGYRVDYVGAHWYGGTSASAFKERMIAIYKKYGRRPLMITEFAPADWRAKTPGGNRHTPAAVLAFMKDVLPWMEKQDWIAGYAWFSFSQSDKAGTSAALFDREGRLTACGRYYRSVTNENPQGDQSIKPDAR